MALEYKGTLIKDPITGKLKYDKPDVVVPALSNQRYMLPKEEQKIVRDVSGLPTMQTTTQYPINQQPALKIHPMTTPKAAGIVTAPIEGISQGAIPTGIAGYFGAANKKGKIELDPQSGIATGGFTRPKDAEANLAREALERTQFWDQVNAQKARDFADQTLSLRTRLDSAIKSGNQEEAAMLTKALQASSGIQPLDMSRQTEAETNRAALPSKIDLAKAQANLFGQQAAAIPYNTAIQQYVAQHASKNQPQDFNSKLTAMVKAGMDVEEAMALAGIPDNASPEARQEVLNKIRERKKG